MIKKPTKAEFVGAMMSNLLWEIAQSKYAPPEIKEQATLFQQRWDSVSTFRLNNPITLANLEKEFFPEEIA